jgi:hypothetical protein
LVLAENEIHNKMSDNGFTAVWFSFSEVIFLDLIFYFVF